MVETHHQDMVETHHQDTAVPTTEWSRWTVCRTLAVARTLVKGKAPSNSIRLRPLTSRISIFQEPSSNQALLVPGLSPRLVSRNTSYLHALSRIVVQSESKSQIPSSLEAMLDVIAGSIMTVAKAGMKELGAR